MPKPKPAAKSRLKPCSAAACAIQECLAANGYKESRCKTQIDAFFDCCQRTPSSPLCPAELPPRPAQ